VNVLGFTAFSPTYIYGKSVSPVGRNSEAYCAVCMRHII
jgi:hypothetical protein